MKRYYIDTTKLVCGRLSNGGDRGCIIGQILLAEGFSRITLSQRNTPSAIAKTGRVVPDWMLDELDKNRDSKTAVAVECASDNFLLGSTSRDLMERQVCDALAPLGIEIKFLP